MKRTKQEMRAARAKSHKERSGKINKEKQLRDLKRKKRMEKTEMVMAKKPSFPAPLPSPKVKINPWDKNYAHVAKKEEATK